MSFDIAPTDAETDLPVLPPKPDYAPTVSEEPEKVPEKKSFKGKMSALRKKTSTVRMATTDKLREKADEWTDKADTKDAEKKADEEKAVKKKGLRKEVKESAEGLVDARREVREAKRKEAEAAPDSVEMVEAIAALEKANQTLAQRAAALEEKSRGEKWAEGLEEAVRKEVSRRERRSARGDAVTAYRRYRDLDRPGLISAAWQGGWAWFVSGGTLLAIYDRFLILSGMHQKLSGLPRAEYLAGGAEPHTWDLFQGVPDQMRDHLQAAMDAGSTGTFMSILFLLALPVASAEYWRTTLHRKNSALYWALRMPLVGYITGLLAFIIEIGK